jgi:hypothetical protein
MLFWPGIWGYSGIEVKEAFLGLFCFLEFLLNGAENIESSKK